ncbi:MAG TPA: CbiX/SirB N-terminal domain-containing protein [Planctomycetaceae bacterium]|nr:CbiX/SirB N-terminal domain-containing protein [Planctomycetaceae bacterium]
MTDSSPPGELIETAVIIVDHGSRRSESNAMLHQAAERFMSDSASAIVEPAHMELAEPSIAAAFDRCVQRGARRVVVFPYFLSPGRHWTEDIPRLVSDAARQHPGVEWLVTAPFGLHPSMNAIISDRIELCLQNATASLQDAPSSGCDVCKGTSGCQLHVSEDS